MTDEPQSTELTPEERAQAAEVSPRIAQAVIEAHQKGGTEAEVRKAGEEAVDREKGLNISAQDKRELVDMFISGLRDAGAFEKPEPEPTPSPTPATSSSSSTAPAPTPEQAAAHAAAAAATQPTPAKRTWAERFAGI